MSITKKGKKVMKKKFLKLIIAVFVGGILLLPQYCPKHQRVDDCWQMEQPHGDEKGPK